MQHLRHHNNGSPSSVRSLLWKFISYVNRHGLYKIIMEHNFLEILDKKGKKWPELLARWPVVFYIFLYCYYHCRVTINGIEINKSNKMFLMKEEMLKTTLRLIFRGIYTLYLLMPYQNLFISTLPVEFLL